MAGGKFRKPDKKEQKSGQEDVNHDAPKVAPNNVKNSKVTDFAQKPGYIIATLFIGLLAGVGGVPGIIQLFSYFSDAPEMNFHHDATYIDTAGLNSPYRTYVILSGIIQNKGEKPLLIKDVFRLTLEIPGQEPIEAKGEPLPDSMTIRDPTTQADIAFKSVIDLQSIMKLMPADPIACSMKFKFTANFGEVVNPNAIYRLSCTDSDENEYSEVFPLRLRKPMHGEMLPKSKIFYRPVQIPATSDGN